VDYLKRMNVASSSQEQIPVNRYWRLFFFNVLRIEPRASRMLGKYCIPWALRNWISWAENPAVFWPMELHTSKKVL
jgi:hypothetical protein